VQRQLQRFGWMASASIVAQALFGLALYPVYRVRVRFADLERSAPAVVQLFDLKEHLSGARPGSRPGRLVRRPRPAAGCAGAESRAVAARPAAAPRWSGRRR